MELGDICNTCQQPINEFKCYIAGDKKYHEEHFTCTLCKESLANKPFFPEQDGSVNYCKNCYLNEIATKCANCNLGIEENLVEIDQGQYLHSQCFICSRCKEQLVSGYSRDNDNNIICLSCQDNEAGKCDSCGLVFQDQKITAIGKHFHPQCFICSLCNNQIDQDVFDEQDGKPVHRKCLNMVCGYCNQGIVEETQYYKKKDLFYHYECAQKMQQEQFEQEQQNETNENNASKQSNEQKISMQKEVEDLSYNLEKEKFLKSQDEQNKQKKQQQEEEKKKREQEEQRQKLQQQEDDKKKQQLQEEKMKKQQEQENQEKLKQEQIKKEALEKQKKEQQEIQKQNAIKEEQSNQTIQTDNSNNPNKFYTYDTLLKNPPADVDMTKKELYLSDEEFEKIFQMKKSEFANQKAWKQKELKQKYKLF